MRGGSQIAFRVHYLCCAYVPASLLWMCAASQGSVTPPRRALSRWAARLQPYALAWATLKPTGPRSPVRTPKRLRQCGSASALQRLHATLAASTSLPQRHAPRPCASRYARNCWPRVVHPELATFLTSAAVPRGHGCRHCCRCSREVGTGAQPPSAIRGCCGLSQPRLSFHYCES